MCLDLHNGVEPNKVLECMVGECYQGAQYKTPDGDTMVVTNQRDENFTQVVSLRTGALLAVPNGVNLGHDRAGRLYASRSLNPGLYPAPAVVDPVQTSLDQDADAQRSLEEQLRDSGAEPPE